LEGKNDSLQQKNQSLNTENQRLSRQLERTKKNSEAYKNKLNLLKNSTEKGGKPVRDFRGPYKKLENFSTKVSAIECDLSTLKLNFPNDCFIRTATVRRLNYKEISRLLEDYKEDIYFTLDNGKVRIYIGPTQSQELLDQVKNYSFPDALIDCSLREGTNTQKTTKVPKIKPNSQKGVKQAVKSPEIEIYTQRFSQDILDGATIEVEGEELRGKTEIFHCQQGQITYEHQDNIPAGKYIQLAAVKSFDCLKLANCQYLEHLIILRVYDNEFCNYRILSQDIDKFNEIKECSGFKNIQIRRM